MSFDPENLATAELFKAYRQILRELTRRGTIRTMNAPAGDYAEYLVATLTKGDLADNSEKSWDIRTPDGERLQVKCRVIHAGLRGPQQLSPFRSWDFDRAVIVLFDDEYSIDRCVAIPAAVVKGFATYRPHVNGHVVRVSDALVSNPKAEDLTDQLRRVAAEA
jgi:hypothetical protein